MKNLKTFLLFTLSLFITSCSAHQIDWPHILKNSCIPQYTYTIVKKYHHSSTAFTEGLIYTNGKLIESTGRYTQSKLQKIDLISGKVLQQINLDSDLFAEGITAMNNKIYQLTYESNVGFVYQADNLKLERKFYYPFQGWGLTNDGKSLIMSDGSAALIFINPQSFRIEHSLIVHIGKKPVGRLNDLEYIDGKIFANIYGEKIIIIIDPASGNVLGLLDMHKLNPLLKKASMDSVMNGIAYNPITQNLLITGKNWPYVYMIKIKKNSIKTCVANS